MVNQENQTQIGQTEAPQTFPQQYQPQMGSFPQQYPQTFPQQYQPQMGSFPQQYPQTFPQQFQPQSQKDTTELLESLPEEKKTHFTKTLVPILIITTIIAGVFYYIYQTYLIEGKSLIIQENTEVEIYDIIEPDERTIRAGKNLESQTISENKATPDTAENNIGTEKNNPTDKPSAKKLYR